MKYFILMFAIVGVTNGAHAEGIHRACYSRAEKATERFAEPDHYDANGFTAFHCDLAPNGQAVICDVSASKGNGAATDTYRVVLSRSCTKTYRVELTGEE